MRKQEHPCPEDDNKAARTTSVHICCMRRVSISLHFAVADYNKARDAQRMLHEMHFASHAMLRYTSMSDEHGAGTRRV